MWNFQNGAILMGFQTEVLKMKVLREFSNWELELPQGLNSLVLLSWSWTFSTVCTLLKVNPDVAMYLDSLQYYLRQNIVHQIAIVPKYTSMRTVFRDVVDSIEVPSADIFLYNKSNAGKPSYKLLWVSWKIHSYTFFLNCDKLFST